MEHFDTKIKAGQKSPSLLPKDASKNNYKK